MIKKIFFILIIISIIIPIGVSADIISDESDESIVIIEEKKEEKEVDKLLEKAIKEDSFKKESLKDKNGNKIYKIEQSLKKYIKGGKEFEIVAQTTFYKVTDPEAQRVITPMASYGDGAWDGSYGAYMHMTIYFERTVYNSRPCVKLLRTTGGVDIQDSLMDVQKMIVELTQRTLVWPSTFNQTHATTYLYNASFTKYPPSNWIPVPEDAGNVTHLGGRMVVTFKRGSSRTWTNILSVMYLEP